MKKKIIIAAAVLLLAALLVGAWLVISNRSGYDIARLRAKAELGMKRDDLTFAAQKALIIDTGEDGFYSNQCGRFTYSRYEEQPYVIFTLKKLGLVDNRYWELIYSSDGELYGASGEYSDEIESEDGKVTFRAEQLDEHWWYYWTEYSE